MKPERIQKLIEQCEDMGALISHWERGFLESVQKQVSRGRTLSSKQVDIVHRVEAKIEILSGHQSGLMKKHAILRLRLITMTHYRKTITLRS